VGVDAQPPVLTGDQYRLLLGAGGAFAVLALLGLVNIFRRPRNAPPGGCLLSRTGCFLSRTGCFLSRTGVVPRDFPKRMQDQSGQRSWLSAGNGRDCVAQHTALTAQSNLPSNKPGACSHVIRASCRPARASFLFRPHVRRHSSSCLNARGVLLPAGRVGQHERGVAGRRARRRAAVRQRLELLHR